MKLKRAKILYLDMPAGISGDMLLASLIDLGIKPAMLKRELKKLPIEGYSIKTSKERRHAIEGVRFKVLCKEEKTHRTFKVIKRLIDRSTLSKQVKSLSIEIFKELAEAEGKVHGISPEKVHFHEVGAVDSIIDIVGTAIAFSSLNIDRLYASAVPTGSGLVETEHGVMPVPAPATIELLKGIPLTPSPVESELTTPTGAVILKVLSNGFGPIPPIKVEAVGYGVGGRDHSQVPNMIRAILGEETVPSENADTLVIETNTDEMSPQVASYLMERLFSAGALDVFFTPIGMKKSRPGTLVTTVAPSQSAEELIDIILSESTSIGVRYYPVERVCLERKIEKVKTPHGTIRIKVSTKEGRVMNVQPEYEDCRSAAARTKVPLKRVINAALRAWEKK